MDDSRVRGNRAADAGDESLHEDADAEQPSVTEADVVDAEGALRAVEDLESERARARDRHLRLAAEFDNYRKRVERERTESWTRAQGELVKRLLDVVDDLERIAHHGDASSAQALLDGTLLVEKKLQQVLAAAGLEAVQAESESFSPESMEAVAMLPTDVADDDDVVADVFQKGYRFNGQLIRPARVRVMKYEV